MEILSHLRSITRSHAAEAAARNATDLLWANIRFLDVDRTIRTIAVTSTIPGEGKSTVSIMLARAAARPKRRVLLMECNTHRRSLAQMLGVSTFGDVHTVLAGATTLRKAVVPIGKANLFLLDAKPGPTASSDLFSTRKFSDLLEQTSRSFDLVIIDTPPLSTFADAAIIAAQVDACLLVVRESTVRRRELLAAREQFDKIGARLLGVVLNACSDGILSSYANDAAALSHGSHFTRKRSA